MFGPPLNYSAAALQLHFAPSLAYPRFSPSGLTYWISLRPGWSVTDPGYRGQSWSDLESMIQHLLAFFGGAAATACLAGNSWLLTCLPLWSSLSLLLLGTGKSLEEGLAANIWSFKDGSEWQVVEWVLSWETQQLWELAGLVCFDLGAQLEALSRRHARCCYRVRSGKHFLVSGCTTVLHWQLCWVKKKSPETSLRNWCLLSDRT